MTITYWAIEIKNRYKSFNRNEKISISKSEVNISIKNFGIVRTSYNYSEDPYTRVLSNYIKK
jgi:hypothetical protein